MMEDTPQERAFVLGLDGIPWNLIERWAGDGSLPNFARLLAEGAAGPLESTVPPTTALAWPSIATGVRPDKHGIYSFRDVTADYTYDLNTSAQRQGLALWDLCSPSVVGNVPMTYPASEIDGTLVGGMMSPGVGEDVTHPPEFAAEIDREIPDYRIGLDWSEYFDDTERFLTEHESLLSSRRELMALLLDREPWELGFFVYTEPDRLQHLVWDEEVILEHYEQLDEILGDVLDTVTAAEATLFVVSDHGFGPISEFVKVNTILKRQGYLAERESSGTRSVFESLGIDKGTLLSALETAGLTQERLMDLLPESVFDGLAERVPGSHILHDVDFAETEAFFVAPNNVYINDTERFEQGIVPPESRADLKAELRAVFESTRHPETDEQLLEVYDGAELFPTDRDAPDLVVKAVPGYKAKSGVDDAMLSDTGGHNADHESEGIFFAWGPDVRQCRVADSDVFDVMPTVMHTLSKPIPEAVDGSVMDIFEPDSEPGSTDPERVDYESAEVSGGVDEDLGDVEERLEGLGYL